MTNDLAKPVQSPETAPSGTDYGRLDDQTILQRYLTAGDGNAFAELVRRHGPLVLGVCERSLRHTQDAEDAFQATFWVLARKAHAIRKRKSLASWLYGVACRIARKARAAAAGRRVREGAVAVEQAGEAAMNAGWSEVREVLDDELQKLPEKYRLPLLLCYLQGKTQGEAAGELGWAAGVFRGRLDRGRDLLRRRLVGRGVTVTGGLLIALFAHNSATAAVPPTLLATTVHGALANAAVPVRALGSGTVGALVRAALRPTLAARFVQLGVVGLLLAAMLGAFAFLGASRLVEHWAGGGPFARGRQFSSDDLTIQLHPDLAAQGVSVQELSRSASCDSGLFEEKVQYRVELRFRTDGKALDKHALTYTLYDGDGRPIGGGRATLSAPLRPGGSADCTLDDPNMINARRLLLHEAE
jgi:RNA polymerase sigma-70 factor (ECF subfamily)